MSSEHRDMRPFSTVTALEDLARAIRFRIGDEVLEGDGGKILDEDLYLHTPISVVLPDATEVAKQVQLSKAELAELDLTIDDIKFVVVLSSGYLKLVEFLFDTKLSDLADLGTDLSLSKGERPKPLRAPHGGCTIDVLFYLASEKPQKVGRPWRFATWISRTNFNLSTEQAFRGFTPKPLTAADKKDLDLAPKTVRYITLGDNSPLEPDLPEDLVEVWIDSDLLAQMSLAPKSKTSIAMQRLIFVDAVAAVVNAALRDRDLKDASWDEIKESILGKVIRMVAPSSPKPEVMTANCESYLGLLKAQPAKFMSFVEAVAGLSSGFEVLMEA